MEKEKFISKIRRASTIAIIALTVFVLVPFAAIAVEAKNGFADGWNSFDETTEITAVGMLQSIAVLILGAVIITACICAVIYCMQMFFNLRKNGFPFTELSSRKTRKIGICFMIIEPAYFFFKLVSSKEITASLGLYFTAGLLIYCFSLAFRYGTELQRESDETL